MNKLYIAYLIIMFIVVITLAFTPFAAMHGPKEFASLAYNAYVPTCHQWIYRSSCIFYDGENHWISDCIQKDEEAVIETEFTDAASLWDGTFEYSRNQIGRNRAERVQYGDVIGYKFANDTRNMGLYISMLIVGVVLPFRWKMEKMPHFAFLILGILPLAVDGTGQLFGLWESTNTIRFLTGILAGSAASVYIYAIFTMLKR
jgi:uncharacterized membrane protein